MYETCCNIFYFGPFSTTLNILCVLRGVQLAPQVQHHLGVNKHIKFHWSISAFAVLFIFHNFFPLSHVSLCSFDIEGIRAGGKKKTSNRKWKLLFAPKLKAQHNELNCNSSVFVARLASLSSRSFIALLRRNYICSWDEWNAEAIINSLSGKFSQVFFMPPQTRICSCNNSGCFKKLRLHTDVYREFTENALWGSSSRVLTRFGIIMLRTTTTLIIWIELWVKLKRDVKRWQTFN